MKHSSVKRAVGCASRGTRLTCSRPGRNLVSFPLAYSPVRRQIGARRHGDFAASNLAHVCPCAQSNCCYAISLLSRQRTRAGVSCRYCVRPRRTGHQGGERARHLRLGCAGGAKRPGLHREPGSGSGGLGGLPRAQGVLTLGCKGCIAPLECAYLSHTFRLLCLGERCRKYCQIGQPPPLNEGG